MVDKSCSTIHILRKENHFQKDLVLTLKMEFENKKRQFLKARHQTIQGNDAYFPGYFSFPGIGNSRE